jgi:hypothetical protein
MEAMHRDRTAAMERRNNIRFAETEITFDSCSYFHETYPDGSGGVMDFYAVLPQRLKARLDAACRDRVMQPGAMKAITYKAKSEYGKGTYQEAVLAFDYLENHLIVAEVLKKDFPPITLVNGNHLVSTITSVIDGLPYRRLASDRKPLNGRLSPDEAQFAAATTYLVVMDNDDEYAIHRTITFKDSEGASQYGTVLKNQTTADLLRTHPEKVFGVVDFILARGGLGGTQKDTQELVDFLESDTPSSLATGWV